MCSNLLVKSDTKPRSSVWRSAVECDEGAGKSAAMLWEGRGVEVAML